MTPPSRARTIIHIFAALFLLIGLQQAIERAWMPIGVPSLDAGDYLGQAWAYRQALEVWDLQAFFTAALTPNVHPPLHALLLGVVLAALGPEADLAAASAVELLLFVGALGGLVAPARGIDREWGLTVGLCAAAFVAWSTEHARLSSAPMTENAALLATIVTLILAVRWDRRGTTFDALATGVALTLAGLVRWNLGPMLLLPLLIAGHRDHRVTLHLLVVPTFATLVVWSALRPELGEALRAFFTNVDSGVPLWTKENLLWLPTATSDAYHGPLGTGLVVLFSLVALRGRAGAPRALFAPGHRILLLTALVGAVALTVHPFKIHRAMHGLVALLDLIAAFGALAALSYLPARLRPGATGIVLVLALAASLSQRSARMRLEMEESEERLKLLDDVVAASGQPGHVVISGHIRWFPATTVALWYRRAGWREVTIDTPVIEGCLAYTEPEPSCLPPATAAALNLPGAVFTTLAADESERRTRQAQTDAGGKEPARRRPADESERRALQAQTGGGDEEAARRRPMPAVRRQEEVGLDWSFPSAFQVGAAASAAGFTTTRLENERPQGTIEVWKK